jgi:hypothetical protein
VYTEITGLILETQKKHANTFVNVTYISDNQRKSCMTECHQKRQWKKVENGTIREHSYMANSRILLLPHFSVGLAGHHTLAFISRIFCGKYTFVFIESERKLSLRKERRRIVG